MSVDKANGYCKTPPGFVLDLTDTELVNRLRLVLATTGLLTAFVDPPDSGSASMHWSWLVLAGYGLYGAALCLLSPQNNAFLHGKLVYWVDLAWYTLIVALTGYTDSNFFLFFFFVILASSFHWGFEEGARVTIAATMLFTVSGSLLIDQTELPKLLMRATCLLVFGYMSAYWGESKVASLRRLALLKDVSHLSNPRFGVDQTIASALIEIQKFFKSSNCLLIARDGDSENYSLRSTKTEGANPVVTAQQIDRDAAAPFLRFPQTHSIIYIRPCCGDISLYGRSLAYDHRKNWWMKYDMRIGEHLADLLEAQSFIATPISLKQEKGWLYVSSRNRSFKKADTLFLNHIASQVFPVIENIQLLDRLASDAAQQERQRISWNIHDTAIQPFLGLKLGLSALRNKADPDNPLVKDLEKLTERASQIAADLRHYAGIIRDDPRQTESVCVAALNRQAAQLKELYGIDIKVCVEDELRINDRLAAEVLQIAKEGLSNICKHTTAQHGTVRIHAKNARLSMQIENESEQNCPIRFLPRSIAERAAGLGGSTHVERGANGATVVRVDIPI